MFGERKSCHLLAVQRRRTGYLPTVNLRFPLLTLGFLVLQRTQNNLFLWLKHDKAQKKPQLELYNVANNKDIQFYTGNSWKHTEEF